MINSTACYFTDILVITLSACPQIFSYTHTASADSAEPNAPPADFINIFIRLYQETKDQVVRIAVYFKPEKDPEDAPLKIKTGGGVTIFSESLPTGKFRNIIVTNSHVISRAKEIFVSLSETERYKGELLNDDSKHDLATVVIFTTRPLKTAALGDSDKLRVSEWVYAIGHPLLRGWSLTVGIISGLHRDLIFDQVQFGEGFDFGNSGGGLFNLKGELIGIPHEAYGRNVGLAISVKVLKKVLPFLLAPTPPADNNTNTR